MSSSVNAVAPARSTGRPNSFVTRLRSGDEAAYVLTAACALSIVAITVLLVYELFVNSTLARHRFGFNFLFTS
ncbi:MAG: hypothetical protein M3Z85_21425, partial [Acidobacteriota bacterium]|nr:hypothetical protein [Acidobacteriota bacterium]